jgi:hypothetical protein
MGPNIDLATQSGKAWSPAMSNMRSENEGIETGGGEIRERGQAVAAVRRERLVVESWRGQAARVKRTDLWIGWSSVTCVTGRGARGHSGMAIGNEKLRMLEWTRSAPAGRETAKW